MRSSRPVCALVVAAALWGVATTGTKYALGGFGPVTLLLVELVAALVVLWTVLLARGGRAAPLPWRRALPLGVLEPALAYLADTVGLTRTAAANASVITGLESTFVVLLAWLVLRERITRSLCLAVVGGLAGLAALEQVSWLSGPGLGDGIVLLGALSAAAYTIVARRLGEDSESLPLTACQFTIAAAAILPVALVTWADGSESLPAGVPIHFWVAAALIGVGGFATSFLIYNWAIVLVEARFAAVVLNLIPAFGLASAVAWLGDPLTGSRLSGAVLIAASVALFTWIELHGQSDAPDVGQADPGADIGADIGFAVPPAELASAWSGAGPAVE